MTNRLSTLFARAKDIHQREGLVTLLKRIFTFLVSFENSSFYVHEQVFEHSNEADFLPKIQNFTFKVVETTQQLDKLLKDGFDLSILDIPQARYRLEKGAILTLTFVEREFAYRGWVAMTEEAKNTFNRYPYKVDFSNNEAVFGGTWTNPKYRRYGLNNYGMYKRREYLIAKGIKKARGITQVNNIAMLRAHNKTREKGVRWKYAKARYLRVGWLQFWKETPIKSIENNNGGKPE